MPAAFIFLVASLALSACGADAGNGEPEADNETADPEVEEITTDEAEANVREKVLLDGQNLTSTILINSPDALSELATIAPAPIAASAEVGDVYLIFDGKQVLYRPSVDRVVQTVAVLDGSPAPEAETQTPVVE